MKGAKDLLFFLKLLTTKRERALGALDGTLIRIPQCFSQNSSPKKYTFEKKSNLIFQNIKKNLNKTDLYLQNMKKQQTTLG